MAFIKANIISMMNCVDDGYGIYAISAGKVMITTRDVATNPPLIEQWYCNATAGERVAFLGDYSRFILFDFTTTNVGGGAAGVSSFNGRPGAVMPQAGDYNAGQIGLTPTGDVAATNLQAAIGELSTEKASVAALTALTTTVTNITNGTTAVPIRHSTLNNDEPQRHLPALNGNTTHYVSGAGTLLPLPVAALPTASQIPFTPVGGIGSNNTQAAVAELDVEKADKTIAINTGAGLTGGGNLTASRTIQFDFAALPAVPVLDNADVVAILDVETGTYRKTTIGGILASVVGTDKYKGFWNAASNTPALADGTGTAANFYYVSSAGTQNLGSGNITFAVNDIVIYNGTIWQQMTVSNSVTTVFGRPGAVVASAGDYNSTQISHVPSGNIAAATVGGALNELDSEKASVTDLGTTNTNLGNLQTAFDNHTHAHSTLTDDQANRHVPTLTTAADYLRGDGTFATFPTALPPGPHTHAHSTLTDDQANRHVPTSGGTNGFVLTYDSTVAGSNNKWAAIPTATPLVFESKSAAFTAAKGHFYDVYLSAPLTITLPATPTVGDEISFRITGSSATNILTFARNGENIENVAADGTVTGNGTISIKYTGTIGANNVGWVISKGQLV